MTKSTQGKVFRKKTSRSVPLPDKAPPEKVAIRPLDPPPPGVGLVDFRSKTADAAPALSEVVRRERIEELISLLGSVHLEIDIPKSRRRP